MLQGKKQELTSKIQIEIGELFKQFNLRNSYEKQKEYMIVKTFFDKIYNNEISAFDRTMLSQVIRDQLFILLILTNLEYLRGSEKNTKLFLTKMENYMKVMGIDAKVYNVEKMVEDYLQSKKIDMSQKILKHSIELKFLIEDSLEKYLYIFLSFSLMLNDIIVVKGQVTTDFKDRMKITSSTSSMDTANDDALVINQNIKCSAFSKQILLNFLSKFRIFDEVNPIMLNNRLEYFILSKIVKLYCKETYDEFDNKDFLDLSKIKTLILKTKDPLRDSFEDFILTLESKSDNNLLDVIGTQIRNLFSNEDKDLRFNLKTLGFFPLEKITLSTSVCIFVSGFTSESVNMEKYWEKFTLANSTYTDNYFFSWQAGSAKDLTLSILNLLTKLILGSFKLNVSSFITIDDFKNQTNLFVKVKKLSRFYGRLLAYILATRIVFPCQTVTLVGFSLGCNIIKYCIKALSEMAKDNPKIREIISDIVFLGGASTFTRVNYWKGNFKTIVNNRIINCHSNDDGVLRYLYTSATRKNPIGYNGFNGMKEIFENYDFTDLNFGHSDYMKNLDIVSRRIKLFQTD